MTDEYSSIHQKITVAGSARTRNQFQTHCSRHSIPPEKIEILTQKFQAIHDSYTHSQSGINYKSRIAIGDDDTRQKHEAYYLVEKGEESLARGLHAVKNGCSHSFESFKAKMSMHQVCI